MNGPGRVLWSQREEGSPIFRGIARVHIDTDPFIPQKAVPEVGTGDPSEKETDRGSCPYGADTLVRETGDSDKGSQRRLEGKIKQERE